MRSTRQVGILALASTVCGLAAVALGQQPPPVFRGTADLLTIDVQLAAAEGKPMPSLTAKDFEVTTAGLQRAVVFAELLHNDEGRVTKNSRLPPDATTRVACMWGFDRSSTATHAHFLLGVEPVPSDRTGVTKLKVKVSDKKLTIRRLAYRSPIRAAVPNSP